MPKRMHVPDGLEPTAEDTPQPALEPESSTEAQQPAQEPASQPDIELGFSQSGISAASAEAMMAEIEERVRKAEEAAAAAAAATITHTVVPGDTLSDIAAHYYHDASKWPVIYEANKDIIGDNPNLILVGQVLTIPKL